MESDFADENRALARECITVSLLNRAVAGLLARSFRLVRVRGEVANFTRAASGHWYFTLKDDAAQVRCAMFRGRNLLVEFSVRDGDEVEVLAQVGLYEPRGEYQLNVEAMQRSGVGRLYEQFVRLKQRLDAEGLFAPGRKRPLPVFPRAIGVVTSLAAAALRDVLTALQRRSPHVEILVYPVPVQGEGAAAAMARMLETVSQRAEVDVVLLVRGGGSIEDLWAFNEEIVARAIRACAVPVVSGVGHESDFTIADFAADLRASTPTAAAEIAAPDRLALLQAIADRFEAARRQVRSRLQQAQQRIDYGLRSLSSPRAPLRALAARLHALGLRSGHALSRQVNAGQRKSEESVARLRQHRPPLASLDHDLQHRCTRLAAGVRHLILERREASGTLAARIQALDPAAVLARGYALASDAQGHVVTDVARLAVGDVLQLRFARGRARTRVTQTEATRADASPPIDEG